MQVADAVELRDDSGKFRVDGQRQAPELRAKGYLETGSPVIGSGEKKRSKARSERLRWKAGAHRLTV